MSQTILCTAIGSRNGVQFWYSGDAAPGLRMVEPHMVAYNAAGHLALSGWFLGGATESASGQGWREYLLSDIANVTVLPQQFPGPRPGYNPSGGKIFHNVQCRL